MSYCVVLSGDGRLMSCQTQCVMDVNTACKLKAILSCNVEASYFTQLKMWLMTTFRCPCFDVLDGARAASSCKQSKRDQDVRRTSKRCHSVTHFQLCTVRSFYVINCTVRMNLLTLVRVVLIRFVNNSDDSDCIQHEYTDQPVVPGEL